MQHGLTLCKAAIYISLALTDSITAAEDQPYALSHQSSSPGLDYANLRHIYRSAYDRTGSYGTDNDHIYPPSPNSGHTYGSPTYPAPAPTRDRSRHGVTPSYGDRTYTVSTDGERLQQLSYDDYAQDMASQRGNYLNRLYEEAQKHNNYAKELYAAAQSSHSGTLDRSDSYGYEPSYGYEEDCSSLDTISLILGLGALAAFVAYLYVQNQAAAARSLLLPRSVPQLLQALQQRYPEPAVLEAITTGACRSLDALEARRENLLRTGGVEGRGMSRDCLQGLIGPAAGFFALGAVVAYALAQAAQAAGARSLQHSDWGALNSAARLLLTSLTEEDECVTSDLCQVAAAARQAPAAVQTPIKLASVATAWYAANLRRNSSHLLSSFCWSVVDGLKDRCPATDPPCRRV